jgi:hypothetical protein
MKLGARLLLAGVAVVAATVGLAGPAWAASSRPAPPPPHFHFANQNFDFNISATQHNLDVSLTVFWPPSPIAPPPERTFSFHRSFCVNLAPPNPCTPFAVNLSLDLFAYPPTPIAPPTNGG